MSTIVYDPVTANYSVFDDAGTCVARARSFVAAEEVRHSLPEAARRMPDASTWLDLLSADRMTAMATLRLLVDDGDLVLWRFAVLVSDEFARRYDIPVLPLALVTSWRKQVAELSVPGDGDDGQ